MMIFSPTCQILFHIFKHYQKHSSAKCLLALCFIPVLELMNQEANIMSPKNYGQKNIIRHMCLVEDS